MSEAEATVPEDVLVRQRWVRAQDRAWAVRCDEILLEFGVVVGQVVYPERHLARYRARKLKRLLTELRVRDEWELVEHVERRTGGWVWMVEYRGGNSARTEDRHPAAAAS